MRPLLLRMRRGQTRENNGNFTVGHSLVGERCNDLSGQISGVDSYVQTTQVTELKEE